jgi:hypothetical protein
MGVGTPLAFLRDMNALSFTSMLALLSLGYITVVICLYAYGKDHVSPTLTRTLTLAQRHIFIYADGRMHIPDSSLLDSCP